MIISLKIIIMYKNYQSKKINHSKSKFGETFKNDFYSLKILKNINSNKNIGNDDNIINDDNK